MTVLKAPNSWLKKINVLVVGAGGNGGECVDALAQFHTALIALGHPTGLNVTIMDDGEVREPNIVRQRFWACDIGQNKAISLANRYNMMMGLDWEGRPERVTEDTSIPFLTDLVISAVDTPSARAVIDSKLSRDTFWLDLGNNARNGQAVLGKKGNPEFPTVMERYPHAKDLPDDNRKSCSTAEAIASQDCLINRMVSTAGMNIVWELMRHGETQKNGIVLDLASGRQIPMPFPKATADASASAAA